MYHNLLNIRDNLLWALQFHLFLKFFVCISTWSEEDKLYYQSLIETTLEKDNSDSLRVFCPLDSGSL